MACAVIERTSYFVPSSEAVTARYRSKLLLLNLDHPEEQIIFSVDPYKLFPLRVDSLIRGKIYVAPARE